MVKVDITFDFLSCACMRARVYIRIHAELKRAKLSFRFFYTQYVKFTSSEHYSLTSLVKSFGSLLWTVYTCLVCLSVCLSVSMSVCLFVCLYVCMQYRFKKKNENGITTRFKKINLCGRFIRRKVLLFPSLCFLLSLHFIHF